MIYLDYFKTGNTLIIKDQFVYFNISSKIFKSNGVAPLSSIKSLKQENLLLPKSLIMTIAWLISAVIVALIFNSLFDDSMLKIIVLSILALMCAYLIYDQFTNQIPNVLKLSIDSEIITFELKEHMPEEVFNQLKSDIFPTSIPSRKYWTD